MRSLRHVAPIPPSRLFRVLPFALIAALTACQPGTRDEGVPAAEEPPAATGAADASPSRSTAAQSAPTTPQSDLAAPSPGAVAATEGSSPPEASPPAIDPTPAGAARVVTEFFADLAAHRDAQALAYWHDGAQADDFMRQYEALARPAVTVDAPDGMEGAAGSSYVTVPVRFAPTSAPANSRERHGQVVVRRVNDVPGSTDEQRRWHIERIDVAMTPK